MIAPGIDLVSLRARRAALGQRLLAVYAAFGFYGLLHYTRAPMSAHTVGMNVTILTEVVTAGLALFAVAWLAWHPNRLPTD